MILETVVSVIILCNNQNYMTSPRCQEPPATFYQTPTGWAGELTNGIPFTQTRITADMYLFEMENVRWLTYKDKVVFI